MTDEIALSAKFLQVVIDVLASEIVVLDSAGIIVAFNSTWQEFAKLNGLDPKQVGKGTNYLEVCDRAVLEEGDDNKTAAIAAVAIRGLLNGNHLKVNFSYPCHSPDNERYFTCEGVRVEFDGAGYVVLSHTDITQLRTAELKMELAQRELRAEAASLKKSEVQLREAREAADRANQSKSRYLAAAGHDLRQPLQTIGLLVGVLERRVAEPEIRTILTKLDDAVAHMNDLLDTLVDINQIEGGAIRPEIADFPVGPLLARAAADFAPLAAAKGLELRAVPSSAVIRSDPRLLARMVSNLLSNAIKYTDHGKILIGCRRRGDALQIEVWDTGIGIPAESVEAIFDEFHRVDPADSSRFGLGLGLYIVQHLAQLLNHTVKVRSLHGKGSMFAFVIQGPKFVPVPAGRDGKRHDPLSSAPVILLVEDHIAQLDTLRTLLEFEGYHVIAARTGAEALARFGEPAGARTKILVTDYNLPGGMSGLDLMRRVRERAASEIPAVIISGDKPKGSRMAAEIAGVQFIAKPMKASDLVAALGALADKVSPGWRGSLKPRTLVAMPSTSASDAIIAVIDDEPGIRDGVRTMLAAEGYGVATYPSAQAFLSDADRRRFRCLVVDLTMPGMDGLELQNRLKSERSDAAIIFLTGSTSLPLAVKAMSEGAVDFLQKPVRNAALRESIARVLDDGKQSSDRRVERDDVAARLATLTKREHQVMERIVEGQLNKNIAAELGISQRTTEHHRQSVMRKMGASSLAMLVRMVGAIN